MRHLVSSNQRQPFRTKIAIAGAVAVAALGTHAVVAGPLLGPIQNGSFEDFPDFNAWTTIGNVAIEADDFKLPVDGAVQGVISSASAMGLGAFPASLNVAGLDTFFNLAPGMLESSNVKSGSGIKQSFSGSAGEKISFVYDFTTNEGVSNDFAFFTLTFPGGGTVMTVIGDPTLPALGPTSDLDNLSGYFRRESNYQNSTLTLPLTGAYTLGFGVTNVSDTILPSGLLLDRVTQQSTAVPLPAGVYATGLGLICMGWQVSLRAGLKTAPALKNMEEESE